MCLKRLKRRSIPACTGEPRRRVGGTDSTWPGRWIQAGLSPRVRGNQMKTCPHCGGAIPACLPSRPLDSARYRSIPACTGEPGEPDRRVYPRVPLAGSGLSPRVRGESRYRDRPGPVYPRVRGNLGRRCQNAGFNGSSTGEPTPRLRSIPACTGEPPAR